MLDKVRETSVDEDILDFLKYVYFGDFSNPIEAASERAYLDMNRTLRLKPLPDDVRLMLRHYPATIGDDWSRSCVRSIIIWVWF